MAVIFPVNCNTTPPALYNIVKVSNKLGKCANSHDKQTLKYTYLQSAIVTSSSHITHSWSALLLANTVTHRHNISSNFSHIGTHYVGPNAAISFRVFWVTNCKRYDATVTICEITLCAGEYMNDIVGNAGGCGSAGLGDTGAGFVGPRIIEIPALVSLSLHCLLGFSGCKVHLTDM